MKRSIKNILIFAMLLLYVLLYKVFIFENYMKFSGFITSAFLIAVVGISILFLGYRKDKTSELKKSIFKVVAIFLVLTFIISYGFGFYTNFLTNAYSLKLPTLLENIIPPALIIICMELIRYVLISTNKDKKSVPYIVTIILIIFELATSYRVLELGTVADIFYTSSSIIIPTIIKHSVLSYICYHAGYKPTMLYRLIMELYIFVLPILPNLGEYINTMIIIIIPGLMFISSYCIIEEYNKGVEHVFVKDGFNFTDVPVFIVVIIFVCLISGYFPHTLIGIGSDSMRPEIGKGYAVIIQRAEQKELKTGEVIAYKNKNRIVVHRIVEVRKEKGNTIYKTKGDANNTVDKMDIRYSDVKGIVKVKIPVIGYPAVWFSELIS